MEDSIKPSEIILVSRLALFDAFTERMTRRQRFLKAVRPTKCVIKWLIRR